MDYSKERELISMKYGAPLVETPENFKVGISRNVKDGLLSINGLKHPVEGNTTG